MLGMPSLVSSMSMPYSFSTRHTKCLRSESLKRWGKRRPSGIRFGFLVGHLVTILGSNWVEYEKHPYDYFMRKFAILFSVTCVIIPARILRLAFGFFEVYVRAYTLSLRLFQGR
jgi:hypothetical protein